MNQDEKLVETSLHDGAVVEIVGQDVAVLFYRKCGTIDLRRVESGGGRSTAFASALRVGVPENGTLEDAHRVAGELQPLFAAFNAEEARRTWASDHAAHNGPSFGVGR